MFSDNTLATDDAFNMQMLHAMVLKEKFTQNQNIIQIHLIFFSGTQKKTLKYLYADKPVKFLNMHWSKVEVVNGLKWSVCFIPSLPKSCKSILFTS